MKVTLDQLAVTQIAVEIPDRCPECGASFQEHGAITQSCWRPGLAECCIYRPDDFIKYSGGTDFQDQADLVTGYRCTACGQSVTGEG